MTAGGFARELKVEGEASQVLIASQFETSAAVEAPNRMLRELAIILGALTLWVLSTRTGLR